jgi:6-phosphofructokinase 1
MVSKEGIQIAGVKDGFRGFVNGEFIELDTSVIEKIMGIGGSILGISEVPTVKIEEAGDIILSNIEFHKIDIVICVGNMETLDITTRLSNSGIPVIFIPQTIENNIPGTDYTIGFHSAVKNIVDSVKLMVTSNISHQREMLVEIMEEYSGFLAVRSAVTLGADGILIPEFQADIGDICKHIRNKRKMGNMHSLFMVSQGARLRDEGIHYRISQKFENQGFCGIVYDLAEIIREKIGIKPRVCVLGYLQRGGITDPYDSYLSTLFAAGAMKCISRGYFKHMIGIKDEKPRAIPLVNVGSRLSLVDQNTYKLMNSLLIDS